MNGYEKLIKTIRSESDRNKVRFQLKLGVMTSPTTCMMGSIELDKNDLYFAEHLLNPLVTEIDFKILSSGVVADKSKYISVLKTGDKVLLSQIAEDKFVIIEKILEVE